MKTLFTGATVVLAENSVQTNVLVEDGKIKAVGDEIGDLSAVSGAHVVDGSGQYLIPGLIELHTDNLEGEFQPRPGVLWPSPMSALIAHDATIVSSGITTVLDSVSCGQINEGKMRHEMFTMSMAAIAKGREKGVLRADHMLHLRCEICDPHTMEMFLPHIDDENLCLVSLMDHTPGQRQFCSIDKYKEYYKIEDMSDEEFETIYTRLRAEQAEFADVSRKRIIELCKERGIALASHDDTTVAHVDQAVAEGLVLSEFPTTVEAAQRAAEHGLGTIMGAPNVVRNGSHSGNVSARLLAEKGLLGILSSDYVPASLLHAAYILHSEVGKALHEALATVTKNPANFLGLHDRGEIAQEKRADMVLMRIVDEIPVVSGVWVEGQKVY